MADLTDRLSSALAGRYRLERELGRGPMAIVFLAQDLKHPRRVAIKVLNPDLTAVLGPERFLREIEISARLQHPHILTLLDSGEAQGLLYYVMLYEGESLRERLAREHQLPVEEALRLAREVADALDHAHRAGVVHRDIKPENILLQAGHAVVADFGIARAVSAAGGTTLTTLDTAIGTPAYMSPEQWMGSRDLDGRSDQYSLGCVLYEMLAGVPPFASKDPASLNYQHQSVTPLPVTSVRPSVPEAMAGAIAKSLAKTPADRFGTAGEFVEALRANDPVATVVDAPVPPRVHWWALVAGAVAIAAVAYVLWLLIPHPSPVTEKKDWILVAEFDGPAADSAVVAATRDLVSAALDQSAIVATVPPEQVHIALEMAGKPTSTRVDAELAKQLAFRSAVRAVVEGRIGRLGHGYSVVVQVLDAESGRVVAAVSETAGSDDELIPTMGRVARRLHDALGKRRGDLRATRELLVEVMTPSFEAYRRCMKARELLFGADNRGAIAMARSALSLDPDCAVAWGIVGFAFGNLGEPDSSLAALDEALRRPGRLVEIDRFMHLAQAAAVRGDVQAAMAMLDQALRHDPAFGPALNNRGFCLLVLGRPEEALVSFRRAVEVSPFGPTQINVLNQFAALLELGKLVEAREMARQLKGGLADVAPGQIAVAAGDWAAAESLGMVLKGYPEVPGPRNIGVSFLAVAQAARGNVRAAGQSLQREQRAHAELRRQVSVDQAVRSRLLLDLVSGRLNRVPEDVASPALVTQGLWEAAAGDTARARRLLARIRMRSVIEQNRQGSNPVLIEAWIATRAGRFGETVRLLGPAALQGDDVGIVNGSNRVLKRWLVAEAYENLGRPDSAAAYFELAMSPIGSGGGLSDARIAYSFAHRRLVLLYARMGRLEEARRHWEIFSTTFTRPDPEMAPLVEEARAALASAEGMAKTTRR